MGNIDNSTVTFGSAFHLLATLANGQFGPRDELFANLFKSYHKWRSAELNDCDFRTAPSLISSIITSDKPLPRKFVFYYTQSDSSTLRDDIEHFLSRAIRTGRQEELYLESLKNLVNRSNNLATRDKEFILQATEINTNTVCEIWFRAFYILMLEPVCVPQAG